MIVFLIHNVASADEGERRSENFTKMKSKVLAHIGKRHAALDTFENCVKSANAKEDIRACQNAKKESMKSLCEENKQGKEKREKRRGKRGQRDSDND